MYSNIVIDLLLGVLVEALLVLTLILVLEKQMVTLGVLVTSIFKASTENGYLGAVVQVVYEEPFLVLYSLLFGKRCLVVWHVSCSVG